MNPNNAMTSIFEICTGSHVQSFSFLKNNSLQFYMIYFFENDYWEVFKICFLEICGRLPLKIQVKECNFY